jgi:hypothetical protein
MLNAIEIMNKSKNVITTFDSNVSRFMKINFDCNVYNIGSSIQPIMNKPIMCLSHGFIYRDDPEVIEKLPILRNYYANYN